MVDTLFGRIMNYCKENVKGGPMYATTYSFKKSKADILILGSSRAYHHIIPQILKDSLGMSCYNVGYNASSIIPQYCRLISQIKRHKPKLVIYDFYAGNDLYINDNIDRFQDMKLFYDIEPVSEVYDESNSVDKMKMASALYRYNSKAIQIMMDYLTREKPEDEYDGYSPFYKTLNYVPQEYEPLYKKCKVDTLKWNYIKKIIDVSQKKNIKLFFTISPWYKCNDDGDYKSLIDYCRKKEVPVFNHLKDTLMVNTNSYFADPAHLNDKGARFYTEMIINDIKLRGNERTRIYDN